MRLLAVHHGGGIGGAPVSLLALLSRLDPADFDPEAVFTEPGGILDYARQQAVRTRIVPTGGAFFYSAHARLEPRSLARFVRTFPSAVDIAQRTLREVRPDVLHLNTSVLLAWAAAARRERVRVVWMVREVLGPNPTLRRWHADYIARHALRIVAISDAVRACFPSSAAVARVYNAIDVADFDVHLDPRQMRRELGLDPLRPTLMTIGSVQRAKGHWLLLDALRYLPSDLQLALITGGVPSSYAASWRGRIKGALGLPLDNLDALRRAAADRGFDTRLYVTGFRHDVPRVLAAADVVAFPSLLPEGFGRPIIEAMAAERPVVATDVGPSRELLGPDAGVLVPVDAVALAEAVRGLLDQPDRRARMGRAGRRRVEACFSLDRQVGEMTAIYRQAAAVG